MLNKLLSQVGGLLNSTHPVPSIAVSSFTMFLAVGYSFSFEKLIVIGSSILAQQFSVGLSNDWLDYERDNIVQRKDKPTARGEVSKKLVRNASLVSAFTALLLASSLGWEAALLMVLMLIVGWSYNLGLKSNALSVVPYAVGFGILPIFVTLSLDPVQLPLWWIILSASLLGISGHFANALPDLFDDRETGVKALPHILGQKSSAIVIATAAGSASLLVVTQSTTLNPTFAWVGFALTMLLALVASALALRAQPPRLIFHLLIGATFVNVVLLMLGQSVLEN